MTWRDLDIYLVNNEISRQQFFELGKQIESHFTPSKMHWRNEYLLKAKHLPVGLYWGIYLKDSYNNKWKIDIWYINENEFEKLNSYTSKICNLLNKSNREIILDIKSKCYKQINYRKEFYSTDIYEAVLENDIVNYSDFYIYLKSKGINIMETPPST
jgi:hypothetical protein